MIIILIWGILGFGVIVLALCGDNWKKIIVKSNPKQLCLILFLLGPVGWFAGIVGLIAVGICALYVKLGD